MEELYDLSRDPYERENLLLTPDAKLTRIAKDLRQLYQEWASSARPLPSHFDRTRRDDTIEKLRALGYID